MVKATCQESGEGAVREPAVPERCFTVYKTYCLLSVGPLREGTGRREGTGGDSRHEWPSHHREEPHG